MSIEAASLLVRVRGEGIRETQSSLNSLNGTVKSFVSSGAGMIGNVFSFAIGGVITQGLLSIGRGIMGLMSSSTGAYSSIERLGTSLQTMVARELVASGSFGTLSDAMDTASQRAGELQKWIIDLAVLSPFSRAQVAESFRLGLAFGFTTEQTQRLSAAMTDFAAGTGASGDSIVRILRALGQMKALGKVSAEELNQLTDAGMNARQILADAFGTDIPTVMARMKDGTIGVGQAIQALVEAVERDYAGAAEKQANTFTGLLASIEDLKEGISGDFFGPIFQALTPGLAKIVEMMQDPQIRGGFQAIGTTIGNIVQGPMTALIQMTDDFLKLLANGQQPLAAFLVAFDLGPIRDSINQGISDIEYFVNAWGQMFYQIGIWIENAGVQIDTWVTNFRNYWVTAFADMETAVNSLGARLNELGNALSGASTWLGKTLSGADAALRNDWTDYNKLFPEESRTPWSGGGGQGGFGGGGTDPQSLWGIPTTRGGGFGGTGDRSGYTPFDLPQLPVLDVSIPEKKWSDAAANTEEAWRNASFDAGESFAGAGSDAAAKMASEFKSALEKIPGLMSTSQVTEADMRRAKAGLSVNYADDYVRQARDELINKIDWKDIDPAEVAQSVGLDPSVPAEVIMDELTRQWESGEYFANPENLAKINWQAVKDDALKEANAALGQENIIAEALKQGITVDSFKPMTDDAMAKMTDSIVASTATPETQAALADAGRAGYSAYFNGWKDAASQAPIIPPGGGVYIPTMGTLPNGPPVQGPENLSIYDLYSMTNGGKDVPRPKIPGNATGTDYWTGGPTWVGETEPELVVPPRGSRIIPASKMGLEGNGPAVVINAEISREFDLERVAQRVASVIQSRRRGRS